MEAKYVKDFLKPKKLSSLLKELENLSVDQKINTLKDMQSKWGFLYDDLIKDKEVINNIREGIKKELDKLGILEKVKYIQSLERKLPDIFSDMHDENTLKDLKEYILEQDFESKIDLIYEFYKCWPNLFSDIEDDHTIDEDTNKILLLFKIKWALDEGNIDRVSNLIHEIGERYGRDNILDKAESINIPQTYKSLFNKQDLSQLKLTLFKDTRTEDELNRDEFYDVYAFLAYDKYTDVVINGETYSKKEMGIENLVKIDKYNRGSLSQVSMMKMRAVAQGDRKVYGVYIPKYMWSKDHAPDTEIPDNLRKFIEENKFHI